MADVLAGIPRVLQEWQGLLAAGAGFGAAAWTWWRERQLSRLRGALLAGSLQLRRELEAQQVALPASHGALPAFREAARKGLEGRWRWEPYWERLRQLYRRLLAQEES